MDDRKRKGIMEDGSSDSPRERARKARETRRAAAPPYAREDGNPSQNAPPPRLVNNQPHGHGLPMGHQQPDAVVLGGNTSCTPGLQAQAAQGSGNRQPATKVCPMCRNSSILFDDAMCVRCASKIVAKASVIAAPPPRPRRQQIPHGLHRSPSPANLAFVTNRPIEQQVRGPSVIQNPHPGLLQEAPQAQAQHVPRGDDVKQQPVLIPWSGWQPPSAVSDGGLQRLRRHMAELDAGSRPVGEHGGAPGGLSAAQIGLPDLQQQLRGPPMVQNPRPGLLPEPPQAQPVPRVDDVKQSVLIPESSWQPLRPQQHPQPPPPVGAGTTQQQQQQLLRVMAELAAGSLPVGASGEAPGALSDARMPVGRYYNPIVPVSAAYVEDGRCPACRHYSARKLLQPREHDCVCFICREVCGIVCPVCSW